MGRLLIIALLIAATIFTVITLSQKDNRGDTAEQTSRNLAKIQAKALSNEALNYSIKRLQNGSVDFVDDQATLSFSDFNVLDGKIDSISYARNSAADSITIKSYVHHLVGDEAVHKTTSALVSIVPANIQAAVSANGEVIVKGNAAVVGDIDENCDPPLNFEEIFGVTKDYVKSIATNYYTDPPNNQTPCENITWVDITDPKNSLKITTTGWSGSGLLVVDGDADFAGGYFYGVIWITGELRISGNLIVDGALFVEGGTEIAATVISGTPVIEFSSEAVSDFLGTVDFPTKMQYKIISIFYD